MTYIGVRVVELADRVLMKFGMTSFGKALVYMAVILTMIFTVLMIATIISIRRRGEATTNGGVPGNKEPLLRGGIPV